MLISILFILVLWGPIAIWDWAKSSYFPYMVLVYVAIGGVGIWLINSGSASLGAPILLAVYVLYAITGGFYFLRQDGNPEIVHFDWKEALREPE